MTHSHSLRDPRKLKAPDRYDGDLLEISPPSGLRTREVSHEVSESEQSYVAPITQTSTPNGRKRGYRGPIVEFNPSLPPAAFPTLDNPCYAKSEATTTRGTFHRSQSYSHTQNSDYYWSSNAAIDNGNMKFDHRVNARSELDNSVNSRSNSSIPERKYRVQPSINMNTGLCNGKGRESGNASSREISPDSIMYKDNLRRMEVIGNMTSYELTLKEMETSDEDEDSAKTARPSSSVSHDPRAFVRTTADLIVRRK